MPKFSNSITVQTPSSREAMGAVQRSRIQIGCQVGHQVAAASGQQPVRRDAGGHRFRQGKKPIRVGRNPFVVPFGYPVTDPFKASDVMHLFPTFMWRGDVADGVRLELSEKLLKELAALGAPITGLKPGENWQSAPDLHLRDGIRPLTDWIEKAARSLLDHLRVQPDLMITGCWANVNAPGTGHRLHSHRNNFLSGAYYLQTQTGADTINFFDPKTQAGSIRPPVWEPTAENTEVAQVRVCDGALILFPAWLLHSVDTNRSNRPRISISFNLMFPSFAETMARPGWTPGIGGQ